MLISSWRHTDEDIRLWSEYEGADITHSESLQFKNLVARSLAAIREFASGCDLAYVSVSSGKDSAATIGLLDEAEVLAELPAVWLRAVPKHSPDAPQQLSEMQVKFPGMALEIVDYDSPVPAKLTPLQADTIATSNFKVACLETQRRYGKAIMGIRADESRQRLMRIARLGYESSTSFLPIGWWSLQDVYSYCASREIPLHPAYGMLGGGRYDRSKIRVDAMLGERGDGSGRVEWEREYYGDILARLVKSV